MAAQAKRIIPTVPAARDAARAAAEQTARRARIEADQPERVRLWVLAVAGVITTVIVIISAVHCLRAF